MKTTRFIKYRSTLLLSTILIFSFTSCKNKKVASLEKEIKLKDEHIALLEEQMRHLQSTNGSLLDRMSDLSIVNKAGAESIQKSLESLSQQYDFIQNLTEKVQHKDSLNLALVMNLKRSLNNINDEDIQVEVRGGIVHVSISDQLLFQSGSSRIGSRAKEVLEKIAAVVNDHEDLQILVEGHTDNVPMANESVKDNWDLSVQRATAVVRVLQNDYYVSPERLTAAGRSEYLPKSDNDSAEGRSNNRRTEIIITPRMDQFFKLLETPALEG